MVAMRKPNVLSKPGRVEVRNERRRPRRGFEHIYPRAEPLNREGWIFVCADHHGDILDTQDREPVASQSTGSESTMKELYLEIREAGLKGRLQATWGRIQQEGETEYEQLLAEIVTRLGFALAEDGKKQVLEEFEGVLDKIEGDIAHVTLTSKLNSEVLLGEFTAAEMSAAGIRQGRRFECRVVAVGNSTETELKSIPDRKLSAERKREIQEALSKLGDPDAPQSDD
jgi:hypothetical protein